MRIFRVPTRRLGASLTVLATLAALAVALSPSGATATSVPLRPGLGHRVAGGDFVGYYVTGAGTKVYCLNPRRAVPQGVSLRTISRYRGVSSTVSHELAYALATWGNARTAAQAAVESQVLNSLAGNTADVQRRGRGLPAKLRRQVSAHVRAARAFRGPYAVRVSTPTAVLPGQSATGSVRVRSAGGHWLPGVRITLQHSANASVPTAVRTNSHGVARFSYSVTDVGQVRVGATATDLTPTALRESRSRPHEQRMVGWAGRVSAHGAASFRKSVSGFSNSYACTTTCNGRPRTTLTACAPGSRYASRLVYDLGRGTLTVAYPASRTRRCATATAILRDGENVRAAWQFRTRHGWSSPVRATGSFTVDCPPAPSVAASVSYDCATARVTIALAQLSASGSWRPLVNRTRHRMVLVVNGATSVRIFAEPGRSAVFTASAACGSHRVYSMQAGVQRANHRYNYGAVASLTTP